METIDELVQLYYKDDNFLINHCSSNSNICCIFFSSLGLYKYNDINDLKRVHDTDRYEWKSICDSKAVRSHYKKIIFVRDIGKVFYLQGINERINSINKLASFLIKETNGMKVYCVGSSAGGYIAYIISNYLKNVERIYSIGGVVDLNEHSTYLEYKKKNKNFHPIEVISAINKDSYVIHFCGSRNTESKRGVPIIKSISNQNKCIIIPLKSKEHAPRPSGADLIKLLVCDDRYLDKMSKKVSNKEEIGFYQFSVINIGFFRATSNIIRKKIRNLIK